MLETCNPDTFVFHEDWQGFRNKSLISNDGKIWKYECFSFPLSAYIWELKLNCHVSEQNSTKLFGSNRSILGSRIHLSSHQERTNKTDLYNLPVNLLFELDLVGVYAKPGQLWWRLPVSSLSIVVGSLKKRLWNWKSFNVHCISNWGDFVFQTV